MDENEAELAWHQLATIPHYHVLWITGDDDLTYTDGHTRACALDHAAEVFAPQSGSAEVGLEAVWIVEGSAQDCPLAHGEEDVEDEDEEEFLARVMHHEPYWIRP